MKVLVSVSLLSAYLLWVLPVPVFSSCSCIVNSDGKPHAFINEIEDEDCEKPVPVDDVACVDFHCAKCGTTLECYVDSGTPETVDEICGIVESARSTPSSLLYYTNGVIKTICEQPVVNGGGPPKSPPPTPEVYCYTGGETLCPDPTLDVDHCFSNDQDLSNFASYTYCPTTPPTCTATPSCTNVETGEGIAQLYKCEVATFTPASGQATITCNGKCDSEIPEVPCDTLCPVALGT